jgi:MFS family permease
MSTTSTPETTPNSVVESSAKEKLGAPFWKLWSASAISNLGDGIGFIAYPWLASAVTRSPLLLAMVALAASLPWLLFSIPAGVIVDRLDRRKIVLFMDLFRGALTAVIAIGVFVLGDSLVKPSELTGGATIPTNWPLYLVIVLCSFLLGIAEVLRDNSAQTLLPSLVKKEHLEKANGRLSIIEPLMGTFIGPPVGSFLVAIAFFVPIFFDSVSFFASVALLALIPGTFKTVHNNELHGERPHWRADLKTGMVWLWNQKFLRTLAAALSLQNLLAAMTTATFILFAQEVLNTTPLAFAIMATGGAVGGILGGTLASRISKRFGPGPSVSAAMFVMGTMQLATGFATHWIMVWAFTATMIFFAILWNVVTVSFRQRVIPGHLFGRVNSVYRFLSWGVLPIGTFIGGMTVTLLQQVIDRDLALRSTYFLAGTLTLAVGVFFSKRLTTANFKAMEEATASSQQ